MNNTDTNKGGWQDSDMRAYLNGTGSYASSGSFYAALPETLQNAIAPVNKLSNNQGGDTNLTDKTTAVSITTDKLWCLSEIEVYGTNIIKRQLIVLVKNSVYL